jgi:hypothetical protein
MQKTNVISFASPKKRFIDFNKDTDTLRMLLSEIQDKYGNEAMAQVAVVELLILLLGEEVEPSERIEAYFSNLAQMFRAEQINAG